MAVTLIVILQDHSVRHPHSREEDLKLSLQEPELSDEITPVGDFVPVVMPYQNEQETALVPSRN